MSKKIAAIQHDIAKALNGLEGVFSTVQWGGRAYKLPGPNGNRKKPRLLVHMCLSKDGDFVDLGFKLKKQRAADVVDQFAWIQPHSFRTLAPSGWIVAQVRQKSQARAVIALLKESHGDLAPATGTKPTSAGKRSRSRAAASSDDARRIDRVLSRKRDEGWKPAPADSFDD
jgi:hypothetical protein